MQCQQPPTVFSLKLSWKISPLVPSFFLKEEHKQRRNIHLCYFPVRQSQSCSLTQTTHGEGTQRCVVCVTELFISSDYSYFKPVQQASTSIFPISPLYIQALDLVLPDCSAVLHVAAFSNPDSN